MPTPQYHDTITISNERHAELLKIENIWLHLQALGVDNWEGYSLPDSGDDESEEEIYGKN